MKKKIFISVAIIVLLGCLFIIPIRRQVSLDTGVPQSLAEERFGNISNLRYSLLFDIPEEHNLPLTGRVTLKFNTKSRQDIIIDYMYGDNIKSVSVPYKFENEHIIINRKNVKKGENTVIISFVASDHSLNRRDDFLYTLLVPDRARTLFPCFDQPDIKGIYELTLILPEQWKGIGNAPVADSVVTSGRKTIRFTPTEPISTYLFSFVAGDFQKVTRTRNGNAISLYHKETNPVKIKQCDEIISQVFTSLDWLENYTGIDYPFSKYDLIILPGFQYGGMEHTGATLYNDRRMFLSENPTLEEEMSRTKLIAHETSHMWFGDFVTMKWFSDVWTKEVFANYFSSKIADPLFPKVNHQLSFMTSYIPGAYAEDRTEGSNAIEQNLDNLNKAGLVYGNIIYQKSPIVMNMLVTKIGEELFQKGIREYLHRFAYGNATWDDLIEILDEMTDEDLTQWSRNWMYEKGMPSIDIARKGDTLTLIEQLPQRGQNISFLAADTCINTYFGGGEAVLGIPEGTDIFIPNADGKSYGYFFWGSEEMLRALSAIMTFSDPTVRGSILIMCNEAAIRGKLETDKYNRLLMQYIPREQNQILYSLAVSYLKESHRIFGQKPDIPLEKVLLDIAMNDKDAARRIIAFRGVVAVMDSPETVAKIYSLYQNPRWIKNEKITLRERMNICYELSIHYPDRYDDLITKLRNEIDNPDFLKEFNFISPAASPLQEVRDSVFNSLLLSENRGIEPYTSKSLSLLNHRLRDIESRKYIRRGLDEMIEVQKTGDIFFPKTWASSLLSGHNCAAARDSVHSFFADKTDYPELLRNKIMMCVLPEYD